jgi:phosphocarrier protein HPr
MPQLDCEIINKLGLHARAAAKLVTLASQFDSDIQIGRNGQKVNGKSIMGVMLLAASKGSTITIYADGGDADQAVQKIGDLIARRFEEAE